MGPKADEQTTCEVLDYFLRRLSSSQVASRVLAMKVLYYNPITFTNKTSFEMYSHYTIYFGTGVVVSAD